MFRFTSANEELFGKIRVLSNKNKFKILELTQNKARTITELSKATNLAYNKCADYIAELHKKKLVNKTRKGREVFVKSAVLLKNVNI